MYTIQRKEIFSPTTFLWEVYAPNMAAAVQPGQFVMVRLKEGGERIPLTIADFERREGTITLVVKVVGKTTEEMSTYPEGAHFVDLIGPLGSPTRLSKKRRIVMVGGGLGIAPLYPIVRGFKRLGSHTTAIIGFRTAAEIFWHERFSQFCDHLVLTTEDGSSRTKGDVLTGLRQIIPDTNHAERIDEVLAIGPLAMMEAVAEFTRPLQIATWASMNPIMVDGIGMCGSCRVTVDGKVLFACIDGPDMDAHKINFAELKARQKRFANEERASREKYRQECATAAAAL